MSATVPMSSQRVSEWAADGYWPDLDYIRRRISIRHVATELGLEVFGHSARCWRGEQHQCGDRSPSLSFTKRNRVKCHVCDHRAIGVLDLVMAIRGCNLRAAVEWVTARWDVPQVEKGRHANRRETNYPRIRVNVTGSPTEELVRRGLWASLTKAARSVLVAILAFSDPYKYTVVISFRALRRYAGVSFDGAARAIHELQGIGLLQVERAPANAPNTYRLCFEAPAFLEHLYQIHQKHSALVQLEKEFQKEKRWAARSVSMHTLGTTVSGRQSTGQFRAPMIRARDLHGNQKAMPNKPLPLHPVKQEIGKTHERGQEQVLQASAPSDRVELERLRLEAEILGRRERARQAEELRRELNAGRGPECRKRTG